MDISPIDLANIEQFSKLVLGLDSLRKSGHEYLHHKMEAVAPNMATLIGDQVSKDKKKIL